MNKAKKIMLVMNLFLLIFLLVGFSYAWFINYGANKIGGSEVSVKAGNMMELSLDGISYTSAVSKTDYGIKKLNMVDISSDGINFIKPSLVQGHQKYGDGIEISIANPTTNSADWILAKSTMACDQNGEDYSSAQYISFKVYFKANAKMDVYLSADSYVRPMSTSSNFSSYAAKGADFSRNWIAAATRISFLNSDGELQYIYAPNSKIKLGYDYNETTNQFNGYQLLEEENDTQIYNCYKIEQGNVLNVELPDELIFTEIRTSTYEKDDNEKPLVTLNKSESGFYEGSIIINLWIEGTDREARRALAGGIVDFNLVFTGFETVSKQETGR